MAKRNAQKQVDMGKVAAGMQQGEPDTKAQATAAQAQTESEQIEALLADAKEEGTPAKAGPSLIDVNDPDAAPKLLDLLMADPRTRKQLGVQPGQGAPSGHYERDYWNESALGVHGGIEVAHEPGFEPTPPQSVPMYHTHPKVVELVGPFTHRKEYARKDATGQPDKTDQYKTYLDQEMAGRRLSPVEMMDMQHASRLAHSSGQELDLDSDDVGIAQLVGTE